MIRYSTLGEHVLIAVTDDEEKTTRNFFFELFNRAKSFYLSPFITRVWQYQYISFFLPAQWGKPEIKYEISFEICTNEQDISIFSMGKQTYCSCEIIESNKNVNVILESNFFNTHKKKRIQVPMKNLTLLTQNSNYATIFFNWKKSNPKAYDKKYVVVNSETGSQCLTTRLHSISHPPLNWSTYGYLTSTIIILKIVFTGHPRVM